jgi:DNA-binding response OmpR family regulator
MTTATNPIEIVVVEDSPEDADLIGIVLQEHHVDCRMRVIRDGATAIQLLDDLDTGPSAPQLDLFIVDINLPKYSGEDVLKFLRGTERFAHIPVIVMSGLDSSIGERSAMKHGATVYFRKPSTLEEYMQLGPIIHDVLSKNTKGAA